MSSMLSSQSGRLDLPKPGCDGAIRRRLADKRRDKRLPFGEAAGAVQEQHRRSLSGLEQLEIDVGNLESLQAGPSRYDAVWLLFVRSGWHSEG